MYFVIYIFVFIYMSVVFIYWYWIYHTNNWGNVSVRGFLCAQECTFFKYIYLYWIYAANIWGKYVSWWVSLRPSGAKLRNVHFVICLYIFVHFLFRLTGAGWGGCIVALVPQDSLDNYIDGIKKDYYATLNSTQASKDCLDTVIFPTQPGSGAQIYIV